MPLAGAAEIDDAVTAARAARADWRAVPMPERTAILYRLADLLVEHDDEACAINALDNGTPMSAMRSGAYTAEWTRYYAGWVDKLDGEVVPVAGDALDVVLPEPYGVVGAIVPWNGPMMGMGQKRCHALKNGAAVSRSWRRSASGSPSSRRGGCRPGAERRGRRRGGGRRGCAPPRVDKVSFTGAAPPPACGDGGAAETLTPLTFGLGRVGQHRSRRRPRPGDVDGSQAPVPSSGQPELCAPARLCARRCLRRRRLEVVAQIEGGAGVIPSTRRCSWARS